MKTSLMMIAIAAVLGLSIVALNRLGGGGDDSSDGELIVFCANGLKKPVEKIAATYEEEFGVKVRLQYGGTGALLSQLEIVQRGDLFIAADESAIDVARKRDLIGEVLGLAIQFPVIAVAEGNPKRIRSIDDLLRNNVKVAVANPGTASIGKATKRGLGARWEEIEGKVLMMKPTVTDLAQDLQLGVIDAAIIWNSTVPQFEGLESVRVSEFDAVRDEVSVAVLTASESPAEAHQFARYLSDSEEGRRVLSEMKFEPVE